MEATKYLAERNRLIEAGYVDGVRIRAQEIDDPRHAERYIDRMSRMHPAERPQPERDHMNNRNGGEA